MHWGFGEWWGHGMGYGFHWIFMVLFWGLVIWFIARAVRGVGAGGSDNVPRESPLEILKRRFATGEIGQEEFEETRKALE